MANEPARRFRGVLAPVVTPFRVDLKLDIPLLKAHCEALLAEGVGLALFGTNSEAASISLAQRMSALEQLIEAGLPPERMMPGTGCCSLDDTVEVTRHAIAAGVESVLLLPPYFYKDLSDNGLFGYFSEVIERLGTDRLSIYLYNIPQFTQVPISDVLVERLLARYPKVVAGLKDSSGNWKNTSDMIARFAPHGFDVFCASEVFLTDTLRLGGSGCISATANVNAKGLVRAFACFGTSDAAEAQAAVDKVRRVFQSTPMISAMKGFLAVRYRSEDWKRVCPPLTELTRVESAALMRQLDEIGFTA